MFESVNACYVGRALDGGDVDPLEERTERFVIFGERKQRGLVIRYIGMNVYGILGLLLRWTRPNLHVVQKKQYDFCTKSRYNCC